MSISLSNCVDATVINILLSPHSKLDHINYFSLKRFLVKA